MDKVLHRLIFNILKALGEVSNVIQMFTEGGEDNGHWVQCLWLSNIFHLGGGMCMFLEWACL